MPLKAIDFILTLLVFWGQLFARASYRLHQSQLVRPKSGTSTGTGRGQEGFYR